MTQHGHQNAPSQSVDTPDFAVRDERIGCLSYGVLRKLPGLPRDLFADYWRDVLGPLCARLPGVGYYVQHHFSQDHRANLWPLPDGIDRMDVVLDGAAEIGFADIDGLNRYPEASPVLFGDVFHLFEHIVAYSLPQGSHTLVDREADGIPNGPDRLYRLHLHLNGGSDGGFRPWLSQWARHLASAPAVRKLRLCRNLTTTRTRHRPALIVTGQTQRCRTAGLAGRCIETHGVRTNQAARAGHVAAVELESAQRT